MAAEQLHELLPSIFGLLPPLVFLQAVPATCRRFDLSWYLGNFRRVIVVPDDTPSVNKAINRLANCQRNTGGGDGSSRLGIVLIRPGIYQESVRVTHNCFVLGLASGVGRRLVGCNTDVQDRQGSSNLVASCSPGVYKRVVVQAPGWESALVFSGLGVRGFNSGEDSWVGNITFQCRNELMRGRCVYIALGRPRIDHCDVHGGILASGWATIPQIANCRIHLSRGNGLHFTDHCGGEMRDSIVEDNRCYGVLIERQSSPRIHSCMFSRNQGGGIRIFCGENVPQALGEVTLAGTVSRPRSEDVVLDNEFCDNGQENVSATPRFAADIDCDYFPSEGEALVKAVKTDNEDFVSPCESSLEQR
eukprot:TRINITY_DN63088_c0_g1_i1.p1 TRINITY_DN63088_c0_g1~~TRINITY_DN63088_c0_g1_i1.p1  ORF type:complete len:386 (-),score=47.56 TRINITY_DN63088_c0_g1_i1:109-1191(-)